MRMRGVLVLAFVVGAGCATGPSGPVVTSSLPPPPPALAFLPPISLSCNEATVLTPIQDAAFMRSCDGFGEPVLEVAGDGAIWYSATCCVGRSPPIWVSRDHGESFELLPFAQGTGVARDAFGIEGDFAIDDAGKVYFSDIGAAFPYLSTFNADGTHVYSGTFPLKPLVDRPWIRAGAADEAFWLYNTGSSSIFIRSTDGGMTWDILAQKEFPCGLMSLGQSNTDRNVMAAAGCSSDPTVWLTKDGGLTWDAGRKLPKPAENGTGGSPLMQPAFTDDGTLWVTYQWNFEDPDNPDGPSQQSAVFLASPDSGTAALQLSGPGNVFVPWAAGGRGIGVAWYYTNSTTEKMEDAVWFLHASSVEFPPGGARTQTIVVDPEAVHKGGLGRQLGDFIEVRMTPDGRMAIAYGRDTNGGYESRFVQSDGLLLIGPATFLNGPRI